MSRKTYQFMMVIILLILSQFCFADQLEMDVNGCSIRQLNSSRNTSQIISDNLRNTWQGVGPWGGDVTSVAINQQDPTILYAAVGNPYISTDSGATWQIWESLAAYSEGIYVITCTSDGIIYAGGDYNDDILKSTDGGSNWTQLTGFPIPLREITVISVDPNDSDIIYVGVAGNSAATDWQQIAKSTDGGNSWTILNTNALGITMGVTDIAIDPDNTQNLVVSAEGGISGGDAIYSLDGGTSWLNIAGTLPTMYPFNDIEISGSDVYLGGGQLFGSQYVGVYKAQMGTFNWQNISTSFPLPVVNEVIVSPDNDQLVYAATEGDGMYISTDGGATWEFNTGGADNFSIYDITLNPTNSDEMYIGCKSMAVFKSSDSGYHWTSANVGIAVLWINDVAVDQTNPDNIIVGFEAENSGGCYMSHDGGVSWEIVETLPATRFSAVAFDINGNVLACSEGPTTVGQEGIYRSTDGGATWTATGPNLGPNFETQLWDIEVSQTDPDLYFISGNHFGNGGWAATIYRTYDAASTDWEEVYIGPDNYEIHSIDLANSNEQFVYAGYTTFNETGSLLRSTDQGTNWTDINNGVPAGCCQTYAVAVDPTNPIKVYAGCGSYSSGYHILKTEDGGTQWNSLDTFSSDIRSIIIDPDDIDHLYASVRTTGVVMSNDAGISWQDASDGLALGSEMSRFSNPFEEDGETKFLVGTFKRSAFKNTMEFSSQLNPPNNVVIELVDFNDVYLSWEQPDLTSATLTGYNIYRDNVVFHFVNDVNILDYLVEGHDAGVYEYYLTAVYDEGESSPVGTTEITVILPAPTNLTATTNWPDILLQWDSPTSTRALESYNVYQDGVLVANVTSTFYLHMNVPAGTWTYNVAAVFTGGWEGEWSDDAGVVGNDLNMIPLKSALNGNYPNPFNPTTEIAFSVTQTSSFVTIEIFNLKGQKIKTLVDETLPAGNHSVIWNGKDNKSKNCSSGVYLYKMKCGHYQKTRKMILLK